MPQPQPFHNRSPFVWGIGHRGLPVLAPENTLASFEAAIRAGADMIEFDVTLSKDKVPVVIHDASLNRTTNGRGAVRRWLWSDLQTLDAGRGEKIPHLEEVLSLASGRAAMNIEIKSEAVRRTTAGGIEEQVTRSVLARKLESSVVVSSFHTKAIVRVKAMAPKIPTAYLLSRPLGKNWARDLAAVKADAIHLPRMGLTAEHVAQARKAGVPVRVYTVNDPKEMEELIGWGVDGLFTDDIRVFLRNARGARRD